MQLSVRRILSLTVRGLTALYAVAAVYIDPRLRLLGLSTFVVILVATILVLWRKRYRLRSWYYRQPLAIRGALAGCLIWSFCAIWSSVVQSDLVSLQNTLHFPLVFITTICQLLAWPIARGGWLFFWGDHGAPHWILDGIVINLLCGLALNATIGATSFRTLDRLSTVRRTGIRWSVRALMTFVAFVSIVLAVYVAYFDVANIEGDVDFMVCGCGMMGRATIADGTVILAEPNHDTPAGTGIATIHVQEKVCTITLIDKNGTPQHFYELSVDHLGAKYFEGASPVYVVQARTWKLYLAHAISRFRFLLRDGF